MKKFFLLNILLVILYGCEIKVNTGKDEKSTASTKIRNGVILDAKGLKVTQAFLLYDDGSLIPPENTVNVGQRVKLRLIIEDGWTTLNDKVMIDASERIETNEGSVLLDEKNLFKNTPEGVTKQDAGFITLSAVISQLDKLYDYFVVKFRVWDKNGKGEVSGSYKLYIK